MCLKIINGESITINYIENNCQPVEQNDTRDLNVNEKFLFKQKTAQFFFLSVSFFYDHMKLMSLFHFEIE